MQKNEGFSKLHLISKLIEIKTLIFQPCNNRMLSDQAQQIHAQLFSSIRIEKKLLKTLHQKPWKHMRNRQYTLRKVDAAYRCYRRDHTPWPGPPHRENSSVGNPRKRCECFEEEKRALFPPLGQERIKNRAIYLSEVILYPTTVRTDPLRCPQANLRENSNCDREIWGASWRSVERRSPRRGKRGMAQPMSEDWEKTADSKRAL